MKKRISLLLLPAFFVGLYGCSREPVPDTVSPEPVPAATSPEPDNAVDPADMLFSGGRIYTVDADQPWAEAIAVKDNIIVYVGDSAGAEDYVGSETERFDLKGKMVVPGFVSGHEHLIASGWLSLGVDLVTADSKEETLRRIKEYADANPDLPVIRGFGWNRGSYGGTPTAADLDPIIPDRPAFFADATIHDSWLNSKALEMGGITDETPDPMPGFSYWDRDENGKILGVGIELAWMPAYVASGAWDADQLIRQSQERLYRVSAEKGLTAYINQGLVTPNVKNLDLYQDDYLAAMGLLGAQEAQDQLQLRTFIQHFHKNEKSSIERLVNNILELKKKYDSDQLRVTGIKIHPEGVYMTKTARMLEPFLDDPASYGERGISPGNVDAVILAGNKAGLDVSIHIEGTQTARTTIDSLIKANQRYPENRNSLQHFSMVAPEDIARTVEHKIPANLTPIWATTWGDTFSQTLKLLGQHRVENYWQQIKTLVDGGVSVSISADVPSTTPEYMGPLMQCEAAITRLHPTEPAEIVPPMSQALTLEECLYAATMGGAYQARMEDKIGSLEVGKYADLVIVDRDLFAIDPSELSDVQVLATLMDGRFTHRDGI